MGILSFGKTLMSNLFRKPATVGYPAVPREYTDRTRGHVVFDESNCILCSICAKKCPADAIIIDKASRTFTINRMECIQCSACVEACPKDSLSMDRNYTAPDYQKVVNSYNVPEREKPKPKEPASE